MAIECYVDDVHAYATCKRGLAQNANAEVEARTSAVVDKAMVEVVDYQLIH